jgi:DNA-binding NarL/FixJ family response regulator
VLLADDQPLVRSGLRMALQPEADIDVVAEAADGLEAVELASAHRLDVVLMDVQMPRCDGLSAARQLLSGPAPPRVLMLTTFDLDEYVYEALRAGASGYLLKSIAPEELAPAIRTVAAGDAMLAPSVTRRLVAEFAVQRPRGDDSALAVLTDREREVLRLVARGLSNAEIAGRLFLGVTTVKTHVANLLAKLDARDRTQLAVLAYERGLVVPGSGRGDEHV